MECEIYKHRAPDGADNQEPTRHKHPEDTKTMIRNPKSKIRTSLAHCRPSLFALRSLLLLALCALPFAVAHSQSSTATLSGTVTDPNNAVVPGAHVTATNNGTGLKREATTSGSGTFSIPLLPPSTYTVLVENQGFTPAQIKDVTLNVGDNVALNIQLKVGQVGATVDVKRDAPLISVSPAVGTVVDRQFVQNIPLNGRSFQTLIGLAPGVVFTPADQNEQGQFSVNGQRANANYFTVDGVSANIGINGNVIGQSAVGSQPGFSVEGGTSGLVSVDSLQEFRIETSTFAPEFGRTPGGQISIATRSGTNQFHGSAFEYFRNDALDANNWFNNALRLAKPPLHQSDFGGVLGGPVLLPRFGEGGHQPAYNGRNRTFFFFSFEGLRLLLPQTAVVVVPNLAQRQLALPQIRPILDAFPLPNGPELGGGAAQYAASYSIPSRLNATSLRIDHIFGPRLTLFGRFNYAPSSRVERGNLSSTPNNLTHSHSRIVTFTFGTTQNFTANTINEFRGNYSLTNGGSLFTLDSLGGAIPPATSSLYPAFSAPESGQIGIFINGLPSYFVGKNVDNKQRQVNLVDNLSLTWNSHALKFGVDYRRLTPVSGPANYFQIAGFNDVPTTAQTAQAAIVTVGAQDSLTLLVQNFSAYGQDTWKANPRLTLTYGLRWDINTPPKGQNGQDLFTVGGLDNLATLSLAPQGTPLYKTTYNNFGPRAGLSYQLLQKSSRETIVRGGFGVFSDLGGGNLANGAFGFPHQRSTNLFGVSFPLSVSQATPPAPSLSPLGQTIFASVPDLELPRIYEWNASVEQMLGPSQALSVSYVGAAGRRLLRLERLQNPNPRFSTVNVETNSAKSDYRALQIEFNRRLDRGLQALVSYTLARSFDTASNDSISNPPGGRIDPQIDLGPSDFDVRHTFSAAVSYNIPFHWAEGTARALVRDWSIDGILTARSATPINVVSIRNLGFGFFSARPDLVTGVPLYLDNPAVPGGRQINRAAFVVPTTQRQGTLSRNALRGFNLNQFDLSLSRRFSLGERANLEFRIEAFNLFNHANFANEVNNLSSGQFGRSIATLNTRLGSGGLNGGLSPLYQIGGPRSIQFALKLKF